MKNTAFIFSNKTKYVLARHISFWLFWCMFSTFMYSFSPGVQSFPLHKKIAFTAIDAVFYMIGHIFLAYTLMYLVIPKLLLKNRYWLTAGATAVLVVASACMHSVITQYLILPVHILMGQTPPEFTMIFWKVNYLTIIAGLRGGISIAGMACTIKLMKYWYVKEQRNFQLTKENLESKLELLKSQVHPHFLFNTLNNLYSLTLAQSKDSPTVVTHLSELLRYMLYECNEKTVSLAKEIDALRKYIELEKLRYGNRLDISFSHSGTIDQSVIAPLLFLPFVENSFKHGVSQVVDSCWINLSIHATNEEISFNLSNSVSSSNHVLRGGIGLRNVKARLELLYPEQHELSITETEDIFNVKLKIKTSTIPVPVPKADKPVIENMKPSFSYEH